MWNLALMILPPLAGLLGAIAMHLFLSNASPAPVPGSAQEKSDDD